MKYIKILIAVLLFGIVSSCSKLDRLLVDPNNPTPGAADPDAFLNQAQLSFRSVYTALSDQGSALSRQQALVSGNLYENSQSPQTFDGPWTNAYSGVVKSVDALVPLALAQKQYQQAGIGQLLKAYVIATLVDDFGDVPYSESGLGLENINPKADDGKAIYESLFSLIDSAVANLNNPDQNTGRLPATDLFYNGDIDKWTAFANTLKLKLYIQERLVVDVKNKVSELEADNNFINSSDQDFQFPYGKNEASPDTRHPHYTTNYLGGGAADYIAVQYMYTVTAKKSGGLVSSLDPRRRYYFYRQVSDYSDANSQTAQCVTRPFPSWYLPGMPYCTSVGSGYWGRDHGDNSGVGPDNLDRTAWGLYPAGGKFDESSFQKLSVTGLGAGGKGIEPIWLSSFTYFIESEAALTLKVAPMGEDARSLLEKGIRESLDKVLGFPAEIGFNITSDTLLNRNTPSQRNTYVNTVLARYDAAANDDARLNIIMEEYYIALWGNGIEVYNNLRRTGKPENLQYMAFTPNPGSFIRSFYYPSVFVNNNVNAPEQKTPGKAVQKVFWDNNPDNFIK